MRFSLFITILFSAALSGFAEKPNILFLFADDLAYEGIRAHGMLDIDTPHLDKLVNAGTSFTHAYNMGAYGGAVCVASRTMFNTGRTLWNVHQIDTRTKLDKEAEEGRMWPQLMKQAGYRTYMTGKWHVKADAHQLFDVARDVRGGMPRQTKPGYNRPVDEADYKNGWKPWETQYGGYWKGGKHWSEVVADHAVDYINEAAQEEEPFFMYIAFNAPHDPRQAPKEYIDRYPLERIELPKSFLPEYPHKEAMGCGKRLRDERLAPFPRTPYSIKVNRQEYYALITHMDDQIGRILDALKASGEHKNTYIFFTADHGLAVGHHGLVGKQNMYDHSMRAPLLVAGPKIKAGKSDTTPIYLQDIMPTTLELAGMPIPEHIDFKSLLPTLSNTKTSARKTIYGAYKGQQRMVIDQGWKLIRYPYANVDRLFNLKADPDEMNDLAANPEYRPQLTRLQQTLEQQSKTLNDPLNYTDPLNSWNRYSPPKPKKGKKGSANAH